MLKSSFENMWMRMFALYGELVESQHTTDNILIFIFLNHHSEVFLVEMLIYVILQWFKFSKQY